MTADRSPVLVTGATGFIGSAVVERLIDSGRPVRALARTLSRASRIARFDLELIAGDVADRTVLARAIDGCDAIVHCAYDFADPEANVEGTRVLADLSLAAGVRRVVHLSTISVHEPLPPHGVVQEDTPLPACDWPYTLTKRQIEGILIRAAGSGLSVTLLRPTIVYGPFSQAWTDGVAKMLRTSRVLVPNGGKGVCNPVYVDDVVDAIMLALWAPAAAPEPLLITGPDHVTWGEFFAAHERVLGTASVVLGGDPADAETGRASRRLPVPNPLGVLKGERLAPFRAAVQARMSPSQTAGLKRRLARFVSSPNEQQAALFSAGAIVSGAAAERVLQFRPAVDFEEGMRRTAQYLHWANL